MSLTVEQLLADARRLSTRLKDHDQNADQLINRSQEVLKEVESMRQYQENIENLNEIAHNRPRAHLVLGIQQENRHIRSLQQENKELRAALEEHQSALELIMSKYRVHISSMMQSGGKIEYNGDTNNKLMQEKTEKIVEMAAVMKEAVKLDQDKEADNQQLIARLYTENKGLRELLGISRKHESVTPVKPAVRAVDQAVQTEAGTQPDLQVTMPAPPPRLNRPTSAVNSPAMSAAGKRDHPPSLKPPSPEHDDIEERLAGSPSDAASESDETSDDDSVKFDTIKLTRRKLPTEPRQSVSPTAACEKSNQINNNTTASAVEIPPEPVTSEPESSPTTTALDEDSEHGGESVALAESDKITNTDIDSSCQAESNDAQEIVNKNSTTEIGDKETASAEKQTELTKNLTTSPIPLDKSSSPTTVINQPSEAEATQLKAEKLDTADKTSPTNPKSETTQDANVKEESDSLKAESPVVSPVKDGKAITAKASDNPDLSKPAAVAGSPTAELTIPESLSASVSALDQSLSPKISVVATIPVPETAVTNCTSIVNDIVTNSMNSS